LVQEKSLLETVQDEFDVVVGLGRGEEVVGEYLFVLRVNAIDPTHALH
jgi:hypothetical protein